MTNKDKLSSGEYFKELQEKTYTSGKELVGEFGFSPNTITALRKGLAGKDKEKRTLDYMNNKLTILFNQSDNYKILIERLRHKMLKESDLSRILHFVDEIIEERKAEFRGLSPACAPGEPAGEKSKLNKKNGR